MKFLDSKAHMNAKKITSFILFFPLIATAYTPQIDMIFDRTIKNSGTGTFIIDTEVSIDSRGQTFLAKESWIIEDAENMRVRVAGEKELKNHLNIIRIYKNNKKYFMEDDGTVKSLPFPESFFEPLFFIRTVKKFEKTLLELGILPSMYTKIRKPVIDLNEPVYPKLPFLRLSRVAGVPSYLISQPNTQAENASPAIWIEQDQFTIRRVRLGNQNEVQADEPQKYANSIVFPQLRTIKWGANQAKIRVLNIRQIPMTPKVKEYFSNKTFIEEKGKLESVNAVPEDPVLNEFYSRFR